MTNNPATGTGRQMSALDQLCLGAEGLLRAAFSKTDDLTGRPSPAVNVPDAELSDRERRHVAGLMRVNHVGEVCAQALYLGQSLSARDGDTRAHLQHAAREEADHLRWCAQRVQALNSHTSVLNPLWFGGAFGLGALAGMFGDGWNLGFVVETENQVEAHLADHLQQLPAQDQQSRAILEKMQSDEVAHAQAARDRGARELPLPIKLAMKVSAKVMTSTAYYL